MSQDVIYHTYLPEAANQIGGDLPYFVGRQYGSGWLGTLARVAFPIIKRIAGVASKAADDVIYQNKPVKTALVDNAMDAVRGFVQPNSPSSARPINRQNTRKRKSSQYPLFQRNNNKRRKK